MPYIYLGCRFTGNYVSNSYFNSLGYRIAISLIDTGMMVVIIDRGRLILSRMAAILAETDEVDDIVKVVNPERAKEKLNAA